MGEKPSTFCRYSVNRKNSENVTPPTIAIVPFAAESVREEQLEEARDAGREISLQQGALPAASSACLAAQLLGRLTAPLQAAIRAERKIRLQEALNSLDPIDREVLALRHFEQLSNGEAAAALGLDKPAASKRYTSALIQLKRILGRLPGGPQEF